MESTTCWNPLEIEQLRLDFLKGFPIKMIARRLSRTPGAVNKALTRFHIRTPRDFRPRYPSFLRATPTSTTDTRTTYPPAAANSNHKKLAPKSTKKTPSTKQKGWVTFENVVEWIMNQNISCTPVGDEHYLIQHRRHTLLQVLLFANKQRIAQGLDIFFVEGLTW